MSTAPGAFDATRYRQQVLAVLRRRPTLELSDPFFVTDLPIDVDDERLIAARLDALVAFWRKEKSPNYRALALELARRRGDLDAVLLDAGARRRVADQVRSARAATDADRYQALDRLAGRLTARHGGVPRSRLPQLQALALGRGLDEGAFQDWAGRQRVVDDGPASADPLPAPLRHQIRAALDELGRLTSAPARTATLWTLLGVPAEASGEDVTAAHARLHAANQRRQHDRRQTVTADLLAMVKQHLLTGDRSRYAASLVEDAKDRVRDTVTEAVIVDGELTAGDYEACVLKVLGCGFGLSAEQARAAVRELVTGLGASLATAPAVDYVVCAACREPQQSTGRTDCRYCGTALYRSCPSCGRSTEAAVDCCAHCGASDQAARAAQEVLESARGALNRGRPREARSVLASAGRSAAEMPGLVRDLEALTTEVDRVVTVSVAEWRGVDRDLAERRLYAAVARVTRLVRTAADVLSPAGETAAHRLRELAERKAGVQAQVTAARVLPDGQREVALARVLAVAADCDEALDLLTRIPLAPPTDVVAVHGAEEVLLRWRPSTAPGAIAYRITRVLRSGAGAVDRRVIGSTAGCEFQDAGIPGGAIVVHEVVATAGRRTSTPALTQPGLAVRDVTGLTATPVSDGIRLSWVLGIAAGVVIVERAVDPVSGLAAPLRRAHADGQVYVDRDAQPGVSYTYRVYAEYRSCDGAVVRTAGQEVSARVTRRPQAVTDLWATTGTDGRTTISWSPTASGEVRVFASDGPLAVPDSDVRLSDLARRARFVGGGRRRTSDTAARGWVTYTPVAIDGDRAVAGLPAAHLAVPAAEDLLVTDLGDELHVAFTLPPGVTEAVVLHRRAIPPRGPDDPDAERRKVTNIRLDISGGCTVSAPADGSTWFVAVHSGTRDAAGVLQVAPTGIHVRARDAVPVRVTYQVRRSHLRRRSVVVDVSADGPLPPLRLVAKPHGIPTSERDGQVVAVVAPGHRTARLELGPGDLPQRAGLRLVTDPHTDRPVELVHPADHELLVSG